MAAFDYKALDAKGKTIKGVIEAETARQARQLLKERALIPTELEQVREKEKKQAGTSGFARGISVAELSLIARQLATLVQAAMPLEECLKALAEQTETPRLKSMLTSVRAKVVEGYTLSDSFGDYPHIFDNLFRSMVAAGEKSGHLGEVLERLADYVENRQQIASKLTQAMVYPSVLTFACVLIVSFLLTSVVPDIVGQFTSTGAELPRMTQILLILSDFVTNWGWLVVSFVVSVIFVTKTLLKNDQHRLNWDKKILTLPVAGKVARGINTSRFARTLSICTSSAIPLLDGMKVSANVISNSWVKAKVIEASDRVREGTSLRAALDNSKLFPPMMLHMIASGERSGELESMLRRAADNQDRAFESQINIALGIFTPLLVFVMAGIVLFIVVATLMPIIQLNNVVG